MISRFWACRNGCEFSLTNHKCSPIFQSPHIYGSLPIKRSNLVAFCVHKYSCKCISKYGTYYDNKVPMKILLCTNWNHINSIFYYRRKQLDGLNNIYDTDNVFLITSRIGKVWIETQNSFDLNDGKLCEFTLLLSKNMTIICTCFDIDWHEYLCIKTKPEDYYDLFVNCHMAITMIIS